MKHIISLAILLVSFSIAATSQDIEVSSNENPSNDISYWIFQIRPTSIAARTPRIGLGIEYQTKKKFAFCLDFGFANSIMANKTKESFYKLFEVRPEIKYYVNDKKSIYLSSEFFYINYRKTKLEDYIILNNGEVEGLSYDSADYEKDKYGLHLKIGAKKKISSILEFDAFFGIGMANISTQINNMTSSTEIELPPENFNQFERREFSAMRSHATIGFRFGFNLNQIFQKS